MDALIGYAPLYDDPLVGPLLAYVDDPSEVAARRLGGALVTLGTSVPFAVALRVLGASGPLPEAARGGLLGRRGRVLSRELGILGRVAHEPLRAALDAHGLGDYVPDDPPAPSAALPAATVGIAMRMAESRDWAGFAGEITGFHRHEGIGPLATHRALRVVDGELYGIEHPDMVLESDLVGGTDVRERLAETLRAFVTGGPAVDVLLYGPPGTGKSTTVHALAAAFADDGLRLVQIERREMSHLSAVMEALRGEGPRTVIVLDDLVFDENERSDRALRAMLEGDASRRPANLAVWATSNRMRLIHETRTEREDDVEEHLGRGERSALASRFGLRIGFGFLTVEGFLDVARALVRRRLGTVPADVDAGARRFAVDRGLTPRAARQFADLYVGGTGTR